jgi:hypothetical protein
MNRLSGQRGGNATAFVVTLIFVAVYLTIAFGLPLAAVSILRASFGVENMDRPLGNIIIFAILTIGVALSGWYTWRLMVKLAPQWVLDQLKHLRR